VAVRYDLHDAGVYVCAPDVLLLFSDNFDFQHVQRDFLRGVLSEQELGNKLYVHELAREYAAQARAQRLGTHMHYAFESVICCSQRLDCRGWKWWRQDALAGPLGTRSHG
jgi:hypothetical protein